MKDTLPSRDSIIWWLGFWASVLAYGASLADIIPSQYAPKVIAIAALLGFISGKLGNSPLPGDNNKEK